MCVFFFKQKTAYEMRISDWSSDVCSSDLLNAAFGLAEICAELIGSLDVPVFTKASLQYCEAFNSDSAWQEKHLGQTFQKPNLGPGHSRLTAYAGWFLKDRALQARAWTDFYGGSAGSKLGIQSLPPLTPPDRLNEKDEP